MKRRSNYKPAHPDAFERLRMFERAVANLNALRIRNRIEVLIEMLIESEMEAS